MPKTHLFLSVPAVARSEIAAASPHPLSLSPSPAPSPARQSWGSDTGTSYWLTTT